MKIPRRTATGPGGRGGQTGAPDELAAHGLAAGEVMARLHSGAEGLSSSEAAARLERYGENRLPEAAQPSLALVIARQFASPVIYILLAAAALSAVLGEWTDAGFIGFVLLLNAAIGGAQEYGAERGAAALRRLVAGVARVLRDGEADEISAAQVVPGDVILLDAGARVPADSRLIESIGLDVDESLLTGESLAVAKRVDAAVAADATLGDRANMVFAGTVVMHGRAHAVVTATGDRAEIGRIAARVAGTRGARPPLLVRMEQLTRAIALGVGVAVILTSAVSLARGTSPIDVFHVSVALAVSAIPEGLPVALTVALAVASARMARRNVIVRRLVAVEALGSCTFVASDKTGTLTMNELAVHAVALPGEEEPISVPQEPGDGEHGLPGLGGEHDGPVRELLTRLAEASALCNEATVELRENEWRHHGDPVDVALLVFAQRLDVRRPIVLSAHPELARIPFEPERQYAATLNQYPEGAQASVKGAAERVLEMCDRMATTDGDAPLDRSAMEQWVVDLAARGMKVIAVAAGPVTAAEAEELDAGALRGLTLLGVVAMIDPPRPGVQEAVRACRTAGVQVAMVTGDHAVTALAIARDLGMAHAPEEVVTGTDLREATARGPAELDERIAGAHVFARVEPEQKLDLVQSLSRQGHFVAVTGDGVNDAPALRAAHVGVAMGRSGTDVAREAADLILTDDNFASVVSGIEEGRVAYANVRKVVYLLISTGLAELILVFLSLLTGDPLPLLPVQLLWLNLVTNGIQDVALAFEPAEGDELRRPPRSPNEPIFNRLMIERVVISAIVVSLVSFGLFRWLLEQGTDLDEARNLVLLQLVLFENVMVGNARSEVHSVFRLSPLRNRILLIGTLGAQLVHIAALYTPGLSGVLGVAPVSIDEWLALLGLALTVLVAIELHHLLPHRRAASAAVS